MYDVVVIGAGPAGMAAGIQASFSGLKTLVIAKEEALITEPKNDGPGLAGVLAIRQQFEQIREKLPEFLEYLFAVEAVALEKNVVSFSVESSSGKAYYAKSVIIATGRDPSSGEGATKFDMLTYKDSSGRVKVDADMKTGIPGIFAAGDCAALLPGNSFTAAGSGATAALSAINYLKGSSKP